MHSVAPPLRDPDELPAPLAALVRRARVRSRDDGARIVLGIEGGGLSVAMACGMALALERLGLTAWLDAVYGTSSGSLMAAYVAGGGTADAELILEAACTREFVRLTRLGRAPVVSVDHLMGIVRARPPLIGAPERPELRVLAVGVRDGELRTLGPPSGRAWRSPSGPGRPSPTAATCCPTGAWSNRSRWARRSPRARRT
jgi:hypothetical protein